MKITLLCPSRQRCDLLRKSIESLGRGNWEIIVRVDEDDPEVVQYRDMSKEIKKMVLLVGPKHGYEQLHQYYNEASIKAKGDWLMLWNDDATMTTENWTDSFKEFDPKEPLVLNFYHEINNLFPAISRKFYEIIGHFSLQTHADSWVQQIGERSGTQRFISGVKIIHNKPTDETGQASTHTAVSYTGAQFGMPHFQDLINQDSDKIKAYIARGET